MRWLQQALGYVAPQRGHLRGVRCLQKVPRSGGCVSLQRAHGARGVASRRQACRLAFSRGSQMGRRAAVDRREQGVGGHQGRRVLLALPRGRRRRQQGRPRVALVPCGQGQRQRGQLGAPVHGGHPRGPGPRRDGGQEGSVGLLARLRGAPARQGRGRRVLGGHRQRGRGRVEGLRAGAGAVVVLRRRRREWQGPGLVRVHRRRQRTGGQEVQRVDRRCRDVQRR
mmetsp:Transcript_92281/g.257929  ORF Transcript_92281/g.257929 Transcript_92281/m.257929 type:complete len:225 (-) Transcript_92281:631-1305(-)